MGDEGVLEHAEVLDDAVVNEGQPAALGEMRVCVGVVRLSMGSPAGMADADGAGGLFPAQEALQVIYLALAFVQVNLAVLTNQGDAGAVITPVLESMKAFYDDGASLSLPDITYDSTHI